MSTDLTEFVPDRMKQMSGMQTPLRRLPTVDEVSESVAFLASDAAAYLSGVTLPVAGGTILS